jgi:hypothetical protein
MAVSIPDLSVILAASGGYEAITHTVRHLARQSIANQIELIVIATSEPIAIPPEVASCFHSLQLASLGHAASVAEANATGVKLAQAAIVVFSEDHCFPDPDWAESLLKAHQSSHAAVGPVFRNANPASLVSWCDFMIGYGPWMDPSPAGERPFLPGHNSSYKRDILLAYREKLPSMLESETVLHFELRLKGHTLWLDPNARVAHTNFSLLPVWTKVQYHCGRVFGGFRASRWPLSKRLFYAAASPLIPAIRLMRCLKELHAPNRSCPHRWTMLPLLTFGLILDGIGQMSGYLFGPGNSPALLATYEYNRIRFVTAEDRERFSQTPD